MVGFLDSPAWVNVAPFTADQKNSFPGFEDVTKAVFENTNEYVTKAVFENADQKKSFPGFAYVTKAVFENTNVTHLGPECAATYDKADHWKCIFGEYRLGTIKTPYLLIASQFDQYQLGNNVGHKPHTDQEKEYSEDFAKKTRALTHKLQASPSVQSSTLSWACYNHCVSESDTGFNKLSVSSSSSERAAITMADAFHAFLYSPESKNFFEDDCVNFDCGQGCHPFSENTDDEEEVFA